MRAPNQPRTILFLISDTGAGHRSAANAISKAMRLIQSQGSAGTTGLQRPTQDVQIVIVDAFAECGRFPLKKTVFLYGPATKHSPRLYGQLFRITNSTERFHTAYRICQPFVRQGLRNLIERIRPDVIVSVHPLLNHVTLQVLRDMNIRLPVITVITDLVSVHVAWIARGVDACVVPTEDARQLALSGGIPQKRTHLLGMPIDPAFAHPAKMSPAARKAALGFDPNLPVVLLVGGGEGAGGLSEAVRVLARQHLPAQLAVITGRNQQLYSRLLRLRPTFTTPTHLFGFVHNMPDMMLAADVIVTKAGPGTISEAMACGLPIVLTGAVPGQEEGNINFVLEHGLGLLATTPAQLAEQLHTLLDAENETLAQLRAQVQRYSRPSASFDIAKLILSYAPPPGVPSVWAVRRRLPRRRLTSLLVRGRRTIRRSTRTVIGRGSATRSRRISPLSAHGSRRYSRQPANHSTGLRRIAGARSLLLRGTSLGKVQLRRTGSR